MRVRRVCGTLVKAYIGVLKGRQFERRFASTPLLVKQEGFRPGDKVVVISDVLAGDVTMNAIQIREITDDNHNSLSA